VGSAPIGVAINPAGTFAYVTNEIGNSVSVINTATNAIAATSGGIDAQRIVIKPRGHFRLCCQQPQQYRFGNQYRTKRRGRDRLGGKHFRTASR
jgi:hypothetical protein